MPYITEFDRKLYDGEITDIVKKLADKGWVEGQVNYIISRILVEWFRQKTSYATIAKIMGTCSCVAQEFYRKFATVYEDLKQMENGSI